MRTRGERGRGMGERLAGDGYGGGAAGWRWGWLGREWGWVGVALLAWVAAPVAGAAETGAEVGAGGAGVERVETTEQREERLRWWREARFGMFIHWGPVSLKGTEIGWSRGGDRRGYGSKGSEVPAAEYDTLFRQFNPTRFDAREWVEIARAAGMRYMVFTSRHHDGFSMFDTRADEYRITHPESPFRRDVVKELAEAARGAGLPFGPYYSQPDWRHPDAFTPDRHERYLNYLRAQVRELCSNYGPLAVFWFDGLGKPAKDYAGEDLVRIIRGLQPRIVINNRTGLDEDHDTPEQRVGKFQNHRPWETCMTICRQWAWKPNDELKSLEQCLRTLVLCAGGDGNLLFNVGPMPDGRIEPRQVDRLREMGAWLARNGESIYATRGGPFKPGAWGASTYRGSRIFVHDFGTVPGLRLPNLPRRIVSARLLSGEAVGVKTSEQGIELTVPGTGRSAIDTIVVLEMDGPVAGIAPVAVGATTSLASGRVARASNVFMRMEEFGAAEAFDDDEGTRWATDSGTRSAWLEVDLGETREVGGVQIDEAYAGRVRRFAVEWRLGTGDTWTRVVEGTRLGQGYSKTFAPVRARFVRLNIEEATEGPTINEFRVLAPVGTGAGGR